MEPGFLYGISVGPGDPELLTVKAAKILGSCLHIFVPKSREGMENAVAAIVRDHLRSDAELHPILFPTTVDRSDRHSGWEEPARRIAEVLETGQDACFLLRGDILLYSTYPHLLRALQRRIPTLKVLTIPGILPFCAAAALVNFPLGRGTETVTVVPARDDLEGVRRAVAQGGAVILINIGLRLGGILDILENAGVFGRAVFVANAGLQDQYVEKDLSRLRGLDAETGRHSTILIQGKPEDFT